MPELPEVETTVAGLRRYIDGQTITNVVFHRDNIRYTLNKQWIAAIEGQRIESIRRRAKLIIVQLSKGWLLWHLGMSGSLRVANADDPKREHDHVEMMLSGGRVLRFHDPRRFGYLKWFADEKQLLQSVAHYGVEPLSEAFSAKYLYQLSRNKRQAVKNFIMNQAVVVGVGNIYACEALFSAGIRPQAPCGSVSLARYEKLVATIKSVLATAITQGGTTLKDFENAEAKPGYFQLSLSVYGRDGRPCLHCQTPLENIKLAGRSSFYCPSCQR